MDSRLAEIIGGLIRAERLRSARQARFEIAQAVARIPVGHSARNTAADREAAREYEARAGKWLDVVKRAFAETNLTWTQERADEASSLLGSELATDWEELTHEVQSKAGQRGQPRFTNLEAARDHATHWIANEIALLVLAQDRTAIPLDEQLRAPRYAAVEAAWIKAKACLRAAEPELPNAVKEAVSAVEQLARIVAGRPTASLGDLIKEFKKTQRIQPPLLKGIDEIWGWASETPGVRHGSAAEPCVDASEARYVTSLAAAAMGLLLAADADGIETEVPRGEPS